eukprot:CAMPEP_0114435526 /NCGR_PEP_ID=MMETSP0103-20121206/12891_1 /TAXON_ID=37642 ORGANISM="Paraphysomonas imperforata, Strain PA2" /NCGR_SAMPLE_ID=MMETSP0103 /ASSEMBLY_ACC=CAM_ASM_000201 /LENGTH=420 /DNA_ID=CAMNT_0001605585 /DNA_START=157 /DNA_END=1419 /DNA_ORIENTATION=+
MSNERLSIAPMLDCTTRHYRYLMRGITRRTVLYTEMIVDSTIIFQQQQLAPFLRHDFYEEADGGSTVVQMGGFDPDDMAAAAGLVCDYSGAHYSEMNINCGCPSAKVVGKCFGAKLMLEPPLVRRIAAQMQRRVGHCCPVTVKCRIGADDRDSYEHLCEFIQEVRAAGVRKFIVHARKCHLSGLSTKQNRNVPPLQYAVVHRLVAEYPDLQFVLNGGLTSLGQVDEHMGLTSLGHSDEQQQDWGLPVHGCMVGRAVYTNPFLVSHADTKYFGASSDPCLTRGELLERYYDYCGGVMQEGGRGSGLCDANPDELHEVLDGRGHQDVGSASKSSDEGKVKIGKLLDAAKNVFHSCKGVSKYRQRLKEIYSQELRRSRAAGGGFVVSDHEGGGGEGGPDPVRIIQQAIAETISPDDLDNVPQE